jgi:hypothetical protein
MYIDFSLNDNEIIKLLIYLIGEYPNIIESLGK